MATITQRADGRYCATIQINGARRFVYGATPRAVEQRLAKLQQQAAQTGGIPAPGRRTVNDLLDQWLDTARPTLRPKTIAGYAEAADRYVRPVLGRVPLARLRPEQLQALYASLQARGLRREPLQVHRLLHRALRFAVLWRWLPENPADRVLRPTYHPPRREVWTGEQARAFLQGTQAHRFHALWTLLAYTGLRLGECLALCWQDVDLDAGQLVVRQTVARIKGQAVIGAPKTQAGARAVTLPAEALAALRRQRSRQAAWRLAAGGDWQDTGAVFTGRRGQLLFAHDVQRRTREQCERLGLPALTPHGLRHVHASLLLAAGVPVPDVSRRLGHANPAITMRVYAHALGADLRAAAAIEAALGANRDTPATKADAP